MKKVLLILVCSIFYSIWLISFSSLCFAQSQINASNAQNEPAWQDKAVGATFKALGKTLIAATDLEKIKRENIKKINGMDEEKFRSRYSEYFSIIGQSPALKSKYGLSEDMTRQQAVQRIKRLNKKQLCEMVDSIPDAVISSEFKSYLDKHSKKIGNKDFSQKVNYVWSRVMETITGRKSPP